VDKVSVQQSPLQPIEFFDDKQLNFVDIDQLKLYEVSFPACSTIDPFPTSLWFYFLSNSSLYQMSVLNKRPFLLFSLRSIAILSSRSFIMKAIFESTQPRSFIDDSTSCTLPNASFITQVETVAIWKYSTRWPVQWSSWDDSIFLSHRFYLSPNSIRLVVVNMLSSLSTLC